MDFGWGGGGPLSPTAAGAGTDLNLLGDNLLIDLDDKTLQCLMGGQSAGFAAVMSELPGETAGSSGKRRREGEGEIAAADDDDLEGDSEEGGGGGSGKALASRGRACKKGRGPGSDAATVKAHREKARRERLNECFEELARLCDPSGKMTRTDRISIVQDAIRALGAVRVENNQLRQLNKFLEERVRQLETARAQGMYQQAMMQQQQMMLAQQQQQQQQSGEGSLAANPSLAGQPRSCSDAEGAAGLASGQDGAAAQLPQQQAGQQSQQQQLQRQQSAACQQQDQLQRQQSAAMMVPPGMMLVPAPVGHAAQPAPAAGAPGAYQPSSYYSLKADANEASLAPSGSGSFLGAPSASNGAYHMVPSAGGGVVVAAAAAPPQVLPANAPPMAWLPAPDISQDQKLRPPAA